MIENETSIRRYFVLSVLLKGLISAAEIIVGVALFFIPLDTVARWVVAIGAFFTHAQESELIRIVSKELMAASTIFVAVYLLSRGVIKLLLIIALLKDKLWAYPSSLAVLGAFVVYQCYQIARDHSVTILALTIFDLIVMYFIWREYTILRSHQELFNTRGQITKTPPVEL